jgi:hypothetical protein
MKRTIAFIAVIALCQTLAFGQKKYEMVIVKTDGSEIAVNVEDIVRTYFPESNVSYKTCPDENHPHSIDLGLPSGTKWACCNVGAKKPEDYGSHYAWGETSTKSEYTWNTYAFYHNFSWDNIGSDIAGTIYDAATANWDASWRMPTKAQCDELNNKCTSVWTQQNGVNGQKFTGPNGGTIFLPAAGDCWGSELYRVGSNGLYWSSTNYEYSPYDAWSLRILSGGVDVPCKDTSSGFSVRPIRKE